MHDAVSTERDEQLRALRARVSMLENELAAQASAANRAIAAAQERAAWLDRLGLDLDHTLSRRSVRVAVMGSLGVVRRLRRLRGAVQRRLGA